MKTFCLSLHYNFRSFLEETFFYRTLKTKVMNRVTLIGNLGRDPEVRRLENGTAVGKFSIATTESYKDANNEWQNLTEWHDIVVWRAQAELAEKTLKKGSSVFIEGKLTHRKYTDKNGVERYATEVVAGVVRSFERVAKNETNFPSQEPPLPSYNRPTAETSSSNPVQSNHQSVPFEVIEPSHSTAAVAEPVGEDGLPF
jgi:single-strand DNA-binding protein